MKTRTWAAVGAALFAASATTATSAAAHTATPVGAPSTHKPSKTQIKNGHYADNAHTKSAEVTFHVKGHGAKTTDLAILCEPSDPSWDEDSGDDGIAVDAPKLAIKNGKISYSGPADVQPFSAGEPITGHTTMTVHLKHVDGPTIHFTYEGNQVTEVTAWKGTVSSPGCASIDNHGKAVLYGPVQGE